MKITVFGGTGLIGKKVVIKLQELGHEVVAASPSLGVNSITGEGLVEAIRGAQVVVDVTGSPTFEDQEVMDFFTASTRNLLAAEAAEGVSHHVALSVVGTDKLLQSGYFRAKMAQEELIQASGIPYTIVRATQFFEFAGTIGYVATEGDTVRLPSGLAQPMVSDDVAAAVADFALREPANGIVEAAGPDQIPLDDFVRQYLMATGDKRHVLADPNALYFASVKIDDQSLVPSNNKAWIGTTRYADWLKQFVKSE